jgi:hypothetical protein
LIKLHPTSEQKIFENSALKSDNVKDAFIFDKIAPLVIAKTVGGDLK